MIPQEDRYAGDCVGWVKNAPRNLYAGDEETDRDFEEKMVVVEEDKKAESHESRIYATAREAAPRNFQIRNEEAKTHAYTKGCAACSNWFRRLARHPH